MRSCAKVRACVCLLVLIGFFHQFVGVVCSCVVRPAVVCWRIVTCMCSWQRTKQHIHTGNCTMCECECRQSQRACVIGDCACAIRRVGLIACDLVSAMIIHEICRWICTQQHTTTHNVRHCSSTCLSNGSADHTATCRHTHCNTLQQYSHSE